MKKKEIEPQPARRAVPAVFAADPRMGLSAAQAAERREAGCVNTPVEPPSRTVKEIVLSNIFTYFNLIFFVLGGAVAAVGAWRDITFLGIVFANILIGIVQELRSKKELDSLTLMASPKAVVIRDGAAQELPAAETVRDDIAVFSGGEQIYADAVVVSGSCRVNEALITGEADEIEKKPGDALLSGSFLVSGRCCARLTAVGADSFVSRLTTEAKKGKKPQQSEMMRSLTGLVKWIGFIVLPFGVILGIKEIFWLGRDTASGVTSTVAALIGMIPEGLYLLTSLALAAGVVRLAKRKTLVHDMGCIETLARVDTLCVDKTGTITESAMALEQVVPLSPDVPEAALRSLLTDYAAASTDENDTMAALRRAFPGPCARRAVSVQPFTSAKKYGGVVFSGESACLLGAPEILLCEKASAYEPALAQYASKGCRVLLLARAGAPLGEAVLQNGVRPLAFLVLANRIRPEAPATFRYFREQGVNVRVISGDNPLTVAAVAARAGIPNAERQVDARTLKTDADIARAAETYTVFGRVTPQQKRKLVEAMKAAGHTVAMTGDGVNDVLALKSADCAVAMASGSEVACQVSHIVLMKSDFSAMPDVVAEGRRVINNIELSASLYLVKNIFSFCLALITLFARLPYPLTPAQLSLVSALTIGVPSFVLALEPNASRISGRFLPNVLYRALPAALTDLALILAALLFYGAFGFSEAALTTVCTALMGLVGLLTVHRTSKPYNAIRRAMMIAVSLAFVVAFLFLKDFFTLTVLCWPEILILAVLALLADPFLQRFSEGLNFLRDRLRARRSRRAAPPARE